jgi:hypothetical protein
VYSSIPAELRSRTIMAYALHGALFLLEAIKRTTLHNKEESKFFLYGISLSSK